MLVASFTLGCCVVVRVVYFAWFCLLVCVSRFVAGVCMCCLRALACLFD